MTARRGGKLHTSTRARTILLVPAALAGALAVAVAAPAVAQERETINLQLYNVGELRDARVIGTDPGCVFALHQDDRDPATDTYAWVFYHPVRSGPDPAPAFIQIDGTFLRVHEVATGGGPDAPPGGRPGYARPFQLWEGEEDMLFVILDIDAAPGESASDVAVESGMMTVIRGGAEAFWVRVKGGARCAEEQTAQ